MEITNLKAATLAGSEQGLIATWTFWEYDHVDHYDVQWQYYNGTARQWVAENLKNVDKNSCVWKKKSNGKRYPLFQDTYNAPTGVNYEKVRVRVRAVASKHRVANGKDKSGTTKYVEKAWFATTGWQYSNETMTNWLVGKPDAPTRVAAALAGTDVALTWSLDEERATHVGVWKSVDGKAYAKAKGLVAKASGSWRDKSCSKGHVYRYKLKSYNTKGKVYSDYSELARVEEIPLAPNKLAAKLARANAVTLTWAKQGTSGSSYVVSYADTAGAFGNNSTAVRTQETTRKTITIEGLERGKTWYFRVQAKSEAGLSAYSKAVSMKLSPEPKDVVTTPTKPSLKALYWDAKMGALRLVTTVTGAKSGEKFEIQFSTVASFTSDAITSVTQDTNGAKIRKKGSAYSYGDATSGYTAVGTGVIYSRTNVQPGTRYWARVRRTNGKKSSGWSDTLDCTVPATTATVAAPTLLAFVAEGAWLRAAIAVASSNAESVEVQTSIVSGEFSDTDVKSVTYDAGWRTIHSNGTLWRGSKFNGSTARGTGVVLTITDPEPATRHWVRARAYRDGQASAWSNVLNVTANASGTEAPEATEPPTAPTGLAAAIESGTEDNVRLTFTDPYDPGESAKVHIQWSANARAFSDNAMGDIKEATWEPETSGKARALSRAYTVTNLDRGQTWYFRVRKTNDAGESAWAGAKSGGSYSSATVAMCEVPGEAEVLSAPTTVATESDAQIGDTVLLAWAHSSEQGSDQTAWQVELTLVTGDSETTATATGQTADQSLALALEDGATFGDATLAISDGTAVSWRVRTQGVAEGVWSPWSGRRTITAWAAPSAGIALMDGSLVEVTEGSPLTRLPLVIELSAQEMAEGNQVSAWWAEVVSAASYEGRGRDGSDVSVAEGEVMWSGQSVAGQDGFSATSWRVELDASALSLASGMTYVARGGCVSAMGLRSEDASQELVVAWETGYPEPTATVSFDPDAFEAHVWPRCAVTQGEVSDDDQDAESEGPDDTEATATFEVTELPATLALGAEVTDQGSVTLRVGDTWIATTEWSLDPTSGVVTVNEDANLDLPATVVVTWVTGGEDEGGMPLLAGALLSVWRIDAGGELVLVADNIANDGNAEVIDPHASFGTCRYRVVATDPTTGLSGSADEEAEADVESIVLSWANDSRQVELPYDVKTNESRVPDVSLVSYAGRSHPVAYRGTQAGESGSWSTDLIRGVDSERLALLRECVGHDCYVREPSGVGYWAYVTLTTSVDYRAGGVDVTLDVTRIETPAGEVA